MSDQCPSFLEAKEPYFFRAYKKDIDPRIVKKFRFSSGSEESSNTIKVYLRIKPENDSNKVNEECYKVEGHSINVFPPNPGLQKGKFFRHLKCRYRFSNIFGPEVEQQEIFDLIVQQMLNQFIRGQNCLIFSYGTTSSGKTYTIHGTGKAPGIIPRVLVALFKSIEGKQDLEGRYYPDRPQGVTLLDDCSLAANQAFKQMILSNEHRSQVSFKSFKSTSSNGNSRVLDATLGEITYDDMKDKVESIIKNVTLAEEDSTYSVWVSFSEIYNEFIYDLLEPSHMGSHRKPLRLAHETNKATFIKGLRHVNVSSGWEAYRVFLYGRTNLSISPTVLNATSSRSHAIFTIKLVKSDILDPESITISSFSICDLAGTERQKKANNVMTQNIKESQNINTSHLVLNRCFKIIRDNQMRSQDEKQIVPFRDSKLTQLFQRALSGHELLAMLVNISQNKALIEETQVVLKASALAHDIIAQRRMNPPKRKPSRFSVYCTENTIPWTTSPSSDKNDIQENPSTVTNEQLEQKYIEEVESLKEELRMEKQKSAVLESNLRRELVQQFQVILDETDARHKKALEEADEKWGHKRRRRYIVEDDSIMFDIKKDIIKERDALALQVKEGENLRSELSEEIKRLREQVGSLKLKDFTNRDENNYLNVLIKALEEKDTVKVINTLQAKINDLEVKVQNLTDILDTAKGDFFENEKRIAELEKCNEDFSEIVLQKDQEIEDLKSELRYVEHMRPGITCRLKENYKLDEPINENTSVGDDLSQQMADLKLECQGKLSKLENENSYLKAKLKKNHDEVAMLGEQLALAEKAIEEFEENSRSRKGLNSPSEVELKLKEKLEKLIAEKEGTEKELAKTKETLEKTKETRNEAENRLLLTVQKLDEADKMFIESEGKRREAEKNIAVMEEKLAEVNANLELAEKKAEESRAFTETHARMRQSDLQAELDSLEKGLKEQIRENTALKLQLSEKNKEIERHRTHLKDTEKIIDDKSKLRNLEGERAWLREQETASSFVTLYQTERQNYENKLEKAMDENHRLREHIKELEKEKITIVEHRQDIVARYDEELRKSKEELEREKREVATLHATFLRPSSTPKKQLEEALEEAQKRFEECSKRCELLIAKNEELENVLMDKQSKNKLKVPCRTYWVQSSDDDDDFVMPVSKTTLKKKKPKKNTVQFQTYSFKVDRSIDKEEPSKKVGRKLFGAKSCDDLLGNCPIEVPMDSTQCSPNTAVKILRTGKKY